MPAAAIEHVRGAVSRGRQVLLLDPDLKNFGDPSEGNR